MSAFCSWKEKTRAEDSSHTNSAYMYRLSLEYSRILHHDEPDGNDYYFEPRLMADEEY